MATPIGNLDDISARALSILASADVIAAEDTRVTLRLLAHHHIASRIVSVRAHNEKREAARIVAHISTGGTVALVTDAGTPAISDPGARVVAAVHAAGFKVVPVPGPNAAAAALSASGLADGPYLFLGFLPAQPGPRRRALESIGAAPYTLVLYEAPHRVVECVEDLAKVLGPQRGLVVARELTKIFEQIHRCALGEAAAWLRADVDRQRGEFVLIVEAARENGSEGDVAWEGVLETLLAELPLAQAVRLTCKLTGAKRKAVYARSLERSRAGRARDVRS